MLDGMTNIKASEVLKELKDYTEDLPPYSPDEVAEALEMAIKALDAQPCEEDFVKHKKEVLERIAKREREIDKYIKELETLKQQPSEDCISRQAVIILIDEASEMHPYKVVGDSDTYSNYNQGWSDACDWLYANIEGVPSVTPRASEEDIHREREQAYMLGYEDASKKFRTQPSEDAVSRSELMKLYKEWQPRLATNVCEFEQALEDLPSVTPRINLAETSQDCISRQAVDDAIYDYSRSCDVNYEQIMEFIDKLPSVTPKYTDEEIDKAQAVEQAYVDKMIELAIEESRQKVKPSDSVNRAAVKLDMLKYGFSSPNITITEFVDSLPPVTPERPKGK